MNKIEGTYGIIKQTKTENIVKKIYKHDALYFTTIKEIAIYKTIATFGYADLFIKIYRIAPNKIYMEKYVGNLNTVNFKEMPFENKLKIIGSIINSMQVLHSLDIIHGDIKPENILMNSPDDVKIIDFGLANLGHFAPDTCTGQCYNIYTWYWRAPEIHAKTRYSSSADIWALALIFLRIVVFAAEDSFVPLMNKLFAKIKTLPKSEQIIATKNILKGLFNRPNDNNRFEHLHNNDGLFDIIVRMIIPNHELRYNINKVSEKFNSLINIVEKDTSNLKKNNNERNLCKPKYSDRPERFIEMQRMYNIGQDNNLSYQIIMHSFMLYDKIYNTAPDFQSTGIEFACIYISCAIYMSGCTIFGGGILQKDGIIAILQLLDYNVYDYNYIDILMKLTKNNNDTSDILKVFKDYINKRPIDYLEL